jgi:hypothetical protein
MYNINLFMSQTGDIVFWKYVSFLGVLMLEG